MTRVEDIEIQRLRISRCPLELHFNPFRRSRIIDEPKSGLDLIIQIRILVDGRCRLIERPSLHYPPDHIGAEK